MAVVILDIAVPIEVLRVNDPGGTSSLIGEVLTRGDAAVDDCDTYTRAIPT
jgi:hypothetical protein